MAESRERWDSRGAFVMAAIGSAIGLGNVWRFPFIVGQYGGGAFFIPYFVALLTAGIPLMIVEYALGVRYQGSAAKSFRSWGRGWEWVGWWAVMVGTVISIYYCAIMAWSFEYLWHSAKAMFGSEGLPWAGGAGAFFEGTVLESTAGDDKFVIGKLVWPLVIGLALTWFFIWWIIHRGVGRVGKIVMITVPLPVIILAVLLVRGLTLPGSAEGLDFYLTPVWEKLEDPDVWLAAYGQIFFSLSLGFGILIAYASYLPKHSDITNNAFITSFANCATSFFAGFVVFSTVGFLAQQQGVPVSEVAAGGPGLAFVVYPTAIAEIQMAPFLLGIFSLLFFLMLLTLGIDSAFSIVEGVVTGLKDKFRANREVICLLMCTFGFIAGLIFVTDAGQYYLDVVDHWVNAFGLGAVGLLECIAVGWFAKGRPLKRLFKEEHPLRKYVNSVSDFRVGWWWDVCVMVITPVALIWLLYMAFRADLSEPYGDYHTWVRLMFGWGVAIGAVLVGFFFMTLKGSGDLDSEDEEATS